MVNTAYSTKTTTMLIGSISDDEVKIIFTPKSEKIYTGDTLKITDASNQGIIAQVYQIEPLNIANITDEALKSQLTLFNQSLAGNSQEISSINIANCKIKLSVAGNHWTNWRGNLPSTLDTVNIVSIQELISHTTGTSPLNPINIGNITSDIKAPIAFEASLFEGNNLIISNKTREKALLINILQEELTRKNAKVLVIDPKGNYSNLQNCVQLEAGKNFKLSLNNYGLNTLGNLISSQIEPSLKLKIEALYMHITNQALQVASGFMPINLLREVLERELHTPEGQKNFIEINTLRNRLLSIEKLGVFANNPKELCNIADIFNNSNLIAVDFSGIPSFWQKAFIRKAVKEITTQKICSFVFFEDSSRYIDNEIATELLYKNKNQGLNNIFSGCYEDNINEEIIKQADNYFMFRTDSIESNEVLFKNLEANKEIIPKLLNKISTDSVVVTGDLSNNYPIVIELRESITNIEKIKHFGSVKRTLSDQGEIVYSYKSSQDIPTAPATPKSYTAPIKQELPKIQMHQEPAPEINNFANYSSDNIDILASTHKLTEEDEMETYQSIAEEYEEEILSQQEKQKTEDMATNIPDEEFLPDHMQAHMMNNNLPAKEEPELFKEVDIIPETIIEEFDDDEFMPQAKNGSLADHIPDEDFFPETHIQTEPEVQDPSFAHHIPDEDFLPEHMQHKVEPGIQQSSLPDQIPDEDFLPPHMQQPELYPAQEEYKHRPAALRPEAIPEHLEDIPVYGSPTEGEEDEDELKEGDQVQHERYGTGIINRVIATGDKKLYSIQFEECGRRLLNTKFAKLTKV